MTHTFRSGAKPLLVACGVALLGLTACAIKPPLPAPLSTERYTAEVGEVPEQLALGVHVEGLSAHQREVVADFVSRWRDAGSGVMVIKQPLDSASPGAAKSMVFVVQAEMESLGVPADVIKLSTYTAGVPKGPVLATFQKLEAKGPDCSGGWESLTSTMNNEPYKHFGCALTADIAAQVADPRDLVSPLGLSPADNTRRLVVLGKYRDGKTTASDKDKQADGAVSSAVAQ